MDERMKRGLAVRKALDARLGAAATPPQAPPTAPPPPGRKLEPWEVRARRWAAENIKRRSLPSDGGHVLFSGHVDMWGDAYVTVPRRFAPNGKSKCYRARRLLWEEEHGMLLPSTSVHVRGACEFKNCMTVAHMKLGTAANARDKAPTTRKMTDEEIAEAVELYLGGEGIKPLARKHGITPTSLKNILRCRGAYPRPAKPDARSVPK